MTRTGSEPDYRFTLANERTFLAYIRTPLGLDAGGLAVDQFIESSDALRLALVVTADGARDTRRRTPTARRRLAERRHAVRAAALVVLALSFVDLALVATS